MNNNPEEIPFYVNEAPFTTSANAFREQDIEGLLRDIKATDTAEFEKFLDHIYIYYYKPMDEQRKERDHINFRDL